MCRFRHVGKEIEVRCPHRDLIKFDNVGLVDLRSISRQLSPCQVDMLCKNVGVAQKSKIAKFRLESFPLR